MRKYSLYEYFYFTRAERNASIVLSCICVFFFVLPLFYPFLVPVDPAPDFEEFRQKIAPIIAQMEADENQTKSYQTNFRGEVENEMPTELFQFDPNTVAKDDLIRLGLSPRTAQTVLNYRTKGGEFEVAEDFKKLYTLRPEDYERLAPYISIVGQGGGEVASLSEESAKAELFPFDPNTATKDDFMRLGLSSRTAQTVLNYRNKGGSFDASEDFRKLYNLSSEDYERLEPWIDISANSNSAGKPVSAEIEHFKFDPNMASMEDFVRLGLSERTAKSILSYRDKGGYFDEKEDFKKIYTLGPADYERLAPWIEIAEGESKLELAETGKYRDEEKKWEMIPVDINTATVIDWEQFRGVGPGFAKRIVKFREDLGGFVSIEQVSETYGLADSTFYAMREYLQTQSGIYRKLSVNKATLEELNSHPYLNKTQASILFNYRKQHGNFVNMESLQKIRAGFKAEDWRSLEPYLTF